MEDKKSPPANQQEKKNTSVDIWETTAELEKLLKLPSDLAEDRVLTWIRGGLYLIQPSQVQEAVANNVRVDYLLFNHLHLNHPVVKPLARRLFQIFWKSVSFYLTDAIQLYSILAANPQIQATLNTPEGRKWVDSCVLNGYIFLWNWVWT